MEDTTRITVSLPTGLVDELRKLTDDVAGMVSEAAARQLRHDLLGLELERYQQEHGAFTEEEVAEADARIEAAMVGPTDQPKAQG
ncbi:hypothetical protein [Microlunatus parietis]|uniref:Post-segregation antitoxin CcdA n=1 Tax=Microlunatus parietis TaxID=682979 RepID=A0A7Y9I742_9ACTN|nr:hypothetical protein [Microlunatus parietis]NYE71501.1 hypothetical protein [Microlunatus parietis]